MTVINKLNQTLESIKSAESQCRTFSMDTDDPNAKLVFIQIADSLKSCEQMLQNRVNYVERQEPQYSPENVKQQIQQQAQQQAQMQNQRQNQEQERVPDID
jgi:hypothetical protein